MPDKTQFLGSSDHSSVLALECMLRVLIKTLVVGLHQFVLKLGKVSDLKSLLKLANYRQELFEVTRDLDRLASVI